MASCACHTHEVNDAIAYLQRVRSRNLSWDMGMSLGKLRLNSTIELLAIEYRTGFKNILLYRIRNEPSMECSLNIYRVRVF